MGECKTASDMFKRVQGEREEYRRKLDLLLGASKTLDGHFIENMGSDSVFIPFRAAIADAEKECSGD